MTLSFVGCGERSRKAPPTVEIGAFRVAHHTLRNRRFHQIHNPLFLQAI
ncbi:hypothetical protein ACKFKG_09790 [Phormidesmis sp. 146-35]